MIYLQSKNEPDWKVEKMENNSENSNNIPRKPRFLELVLSLIVITTISLFVLSACHVNINITNTGDIPTDTKTMDQSEINNKVESLLSDMSIEEKIAQLFFVYPESITGVETTIQAGDATKDALTRYPVGGICYFSKNLLDSNQTKEMLSNTQKFAKETKDYGL